MGEGYCHPLSTPFLPLSPPPGCGHRPCITVSPDNNFNNFLILCLILTGSDRGVTVVKENVKLNTDSRLFFCVSVIIKKCVFRVLRTSYDHPGIIVYVVRRFFFFFFSSRTKAIRCVVLMEMLRW